MSKLIQASRPKGPTRQTIQASALIKGREATGKDMELSARMDFIADAADGDGPKVPSFKMLANTGVPMRLYGFYDPVIVAIKGARFAKKVTPVIMDHDTSLRIGHTTVQAIDKDRNEIVIEGLASSSSQACKEFVADAKAGIPFQCSIGASILDSTYVPEGKSVTVNGKEWEGPLIVANKISIREVTACLLGADSNTETKVAASKKEDTMEFAEFVASLGIDTAIDELPEAQRTKLGAAYKQHKTLLANQNPKGPSGNPPPKEDPTLDPIKAAARYNDAVAQAEERAGRFTEIAAEYEDSFPESGIKLGTKEYKTLSGFKAAAIRQSDMTADQFELHLMRHSRPDATNQPGIIIKNSDMEAEVLEAALARKFQMASGKNRWIAGCGGDPRKFGDIPRNHQGREYGLEAYYKSDTLEKSHDKKYDGLDSIQALLDLQCRAAGKPWHGYEKHGTEFVASAVEAYNLVRASGFSTLNVPNILENLMHKFALAAFDAQDQTWRAISGIRNLSDFRPHNMYRLNWNGHFRQVDQQGQLKHVSVTDSKYTVQADTYGAMITIDRKTIRNDDLGQIILKATAIGMLGAMRIEQSVYVLLLSNPGAFFSSTLGNYISGSTSALNQTGASTPSTPAGLDQARRAFRNLVINGYPIGVSPRVLLVGTSQEMWANQLWAQETFAVAGVSGSVNWLLNKNEFQGLYRPVVTPYLNNTALLDDNGLALTGQSATQWYLFCEPQLPQGSALVVGFIDGRDQPYFDQADTQFNIPGGIQFRAYLDWGVAMNVYQLALKSAGA